MTSRFDGLQARLQYLAIMTDVKGVLRPVSPHRSVISHHKASLYVRDFHGYRVLVDEDLVSQEVIVYPRLALYQATVGYVGPALH